MNIKYVYLFIIFILNVFSQASYSQNTLAGKAIQVPEEEVTRQSQFIEAEQQRVLGHHDQAIAKYKGFLRENPNVDAAWYGLSRSSLEKNLLTDALEAAEKALDLASDNAWYAVNRARIFDQMGRTEDAMQVFENLSKRFPNDREYLRQLAYLAVLSGKPQIALRALDRLEKLTGITEEVSGKKHVIYANLDDTKKAAAELRRLADAYPDRIEYLHQLAKYYEIIGQLTEAKAVYAAILKRNPDDAAAKLAMLGSTKSSSDVAHLNSLKPIFENSRAPIDPKIKELLPYFEKLNKGKPDPETLQLLFVLTDILEIAHPEDPKTWSIAGDLRFLTGQSEEALEKYRKCLKLSPRVFAVWENTLIILAEKQDFSEMLSIADKGLDVFPNQPLIYYYYGLAANALGKPQDALPQLQQALLMSGNDQSLRLTLNSEIGNALLLSNKTDDARQLFEQLMKEGGDKHPGVLEYYGDWWMRTGNQKKAVEFWQKAYDLTQSPALKNKIDGSR